jgi:hypothetical protein
MFPTLYLILPLGHQASLKPKPTKEIVIDPNPTVRLKTITTIVLPLYFYLFYACKHKLFVSLFFLYKNISHSILFQAVQHLNIFIVCTCLRIFTSIFPRVLKTSACKMYLILLLVIFKPSICVHKYLLP